MRMATLGLAMAVPLCLAFGGCATTSPGLPSISDVPPQKSTDLQAVAKAYIDCMASAGVSVEIPAGTMGGITYVIPAKSTWWWVVRPIGGYPHGESMPDMPNDQRTQMEAATNEPSPGLVIDGRDYSSEYVTCVTESGYDQEAAMRPTQEPPAPNPAIVQRQVEVNNEWAHCAREHGFPDIVDTNAAEAVDGLVPEVLIPYTMEPDQLRALLASCPNFDPSKQAELDELLKTATPGTPITKLPDTEPNPRIRLDRIDIHGLTQADMDRMAELYDVLGEAALEHQTSLDIDATRPTVRV